MPPLTLASEPPSRLHGLDFLRAMALLGVGVIHAAAWITPADAPPGENTLAAVSGLARFSVPAFVFASGFALFQAESRRTSRPAAFLRRRWARVLLPWACCVPLFLANDVWRGRLQLNAGSVGPWLATGSGHLYFLLLIAQLYLVFIALPRSSAGLRRAAAALVGLQVALMAWRTYAPLPGGALAWPIDYASHVEAPFWAGTFALGCLAAAEWSFLRRLDRFWPAVMVAALAAGGLVLLEAHGIGSPLDEGNGAYLWPSRLPQTVVWSLALLWAGRRLQPRLGRLWTPMRKMSEHSLGIYLLHPIFLDLLGPFTGAFPTALRVPVLIAGSFGAAYVAVRLLTLTRPTAAAIGETPARRPGWPLPRRLPAAA